MKTPTLNPAQQDAVTTRKGPVLVLAGAGTGKTRVITHRIADLIRHGTRPDRILAVTFTNKAAREMRERALLLRGKPQKKARKQPVPEISTFHALCLKILRRHIRRLGYPSRFAIYDRSDQESLARSALRQLHVSKDRLSHQELLARVSRFKTQGIDPATAKDQVDEDHAAVIARAYECYQEALQLSGAVDFDDLLFLTERLLHQESDVETTEAERFDQILIDEYQDTNALQYRIIRRLASPHRNLFVVGDDDQSIYGWRGAEVTHILRFQRDWPEAKVVRLEENYRSTGAILELANRLIAHNKSRHEKTLRASRGQGERTRFAVLPDEHAEAKAVVRDIVQRLAGRDTRPADVAILFRTNEQPRNFELELRRNRIPYRLVGGMSFYDRKEIRDVLAYMKTFVHPEDEVSLLRILNTPPRGLGKAVVARLLGRAVEIGQPVWHVIRDADTLDLNPVAARAVVRFRTLLKNYHKRIGHEPVSSALEVFLKEIHYQAEIERCVAQKEDRDLRWQAVMDLLRSLKEYEQKNPKAGGVQGFLDEIALLETDDREDNEAQNAITLMTLHSAKGLEFPIVYLVGMEEGLLPHERSLKEGRDVDEERRLCYVGVTRAKRRLTITFAESRTKWGRARPSEPSRFLFEMADLSEHPKLQRFVDRDAVAATAGGPPARRRTRSSKTGRKRKLTQRRSQ